VADGSIDYTVVDSNVFAIHKAYFPKLKVAFPLIKDEPFAWFYPKDGDLSLYKEAEKFLAKIKADGTLLQLKERYYGHLDQLNYVGARTFISHIKRRLPRYLPLFHKAAEQLGIDWRLLAAISYQESHWRPQATSPTGVRGMMMLTQITAREMGIRNRLNPAQSIEGGAQYFDKTRDRIPEHIKNPDRTWMALAAYNIGLGHLEDARILAEKQGMKPDSWLDVQKILPLLQKKTWYRQTKHGYARGSETVKYVQNIRRYYDVLTWMTQVEKQGVIAKEETKKDASSSANSTKDGNSTTQPPIDLKLPDPLQPPPPVL
jgi:membrane-bound lytic murein transglycosylase F